MTAVVLLSGGLDSATTFAIARSRGYTCHALSFDYGQRHKLELECAAEQARLLGAASHRILTLDLRAIGGSALTDAYDVPKDQADASGVPITYVPARNTVFLSLALGLAEVLGADAIFLGVNAIDYSGYPDCRPEFIAAFQSLVQVATKAGIEGRGPVIEAPLLHMTKGDIIRTGTSLGVNYAQTTSCYDPGPAGKPCAHCDACIWRAKGFAEAGLVDPLTEP